jgi:protease I
VAPTQRTPRQKRIDLNMVGEAGAVIALVADGFSVPDQNAAAHAAERGGYKTLITSPNKSLVSGRSATNEEMNFVVDLKPGDISVKQNEGLILPGGAQSIRRLLDDQDSRLLIHDFVKSGKPVFATGEALAIIDRPSMGGMPMGDMPTGEATGPETGPGRRSIVCGTSRRRRQTTTRPVQPASRALPASAVMSIRFDLHGRAPTWERVV